MHCRATQVPRYAGKGTFARIADIHEVSDYDIAILGVPFDGGTSYRPGARFGPMAVRQAARALRPGYHVELGVAPLEEVQVVDAGDVTVTPYDLGEACRQIEAHAADLGGRRPQDRLDRRRPHDRAAESAGAARRARADRAGALRRSPRHLGHLLQRPVTHGTVFRRAFEEGLLVEDIRSRRNPRSDLRPTGLERRCPDGVPDHPRRRLGHDGHRAAVDVVRRRVGTSRYTCRSTSTYSIRRSPPGPVRRKRAV